MPDHAPAPARQPLHLTRRGRLSLVLIVACLLFVAFSVGRVTTGAAVPTDRRPVTTIQPGETLWQVAERAAPSADPRITVQRIVAVNHLTSETVQPGQTIVLPSAG